MSLEETKEVQFKDACFLEMVRQRNELLKAVRTALEDPECNLKPLMAAALVRAEPREIKS